jgi:hypothetical protein
MFVRGRGPAGAGRRCAAGHAAIPDTNISGAGGVQAGEARGEARRHTEAGSRSRSAPSARCREADGADGVRSAVRSERRTPTWRGLARISRRQPAGAATIRCSRSSFPI